MTALQSGCPAVLSLERPGCHSLSYCVKKSSRYEAMILRANSTRLGHGGEDFGLRYPRSVGGSAATMYFPPRIASVCARASLTFFYLSYISLLADRAPKRPASRARLALLPIPVIALVLRPHVRSPSGRLIRFRLLISTTR